MKKLKPLTSYEVGNWRLVGGPMPEWIESITLKINEMIDLLDKNGMLTNQEEE